MFVSLRTWLQHHPLTIACLGYLCITVLFFWPTIFQHAVPLPTDLVQHTLLGEPAPSYNPFTRDAVVQLYPYSDFIFKSYKQWQLPTFNPYIFSGMNFANGQSAAFSLLNVLIPLFNDSLSFFTAGIIIYFFLAGLGMYLFLRESVHALLALAGGVVWQLSAPVIMWLCWGTIDGVLAFFPLTLWSLRKMIQTSKWPWGLALLLFHWSMLTAGHMQFYAYAMGVVICYGLLLLIEQRATMTKRQVGILFSWLIGVLLSAAVIIYPFVVQTGLSHRIQNPNSAQLSLSHLLLWLLPNAWGDVTHFTAPLNYLETAVYVGIVPVILFAAAISLIKYFYKVEYTFWLGVLLVTSVYVFFPNIFQPLSVVIPLFASVPPMRAIFVLDFIVIIIAIYFLQWVFTQTAVPRKEVMQHGIGVIGLVVITLVCSALLNLAVVHAALVLVGVAFVVIAYWRRLPFAWLGIAIMLLAGADQWIVMSGFNPQQSRAPLMNPPAYVTAIVQAKPGALLYSEVSPVNLYGLYGLRSIFGYDSTYSQSYFKSIQQHSKILSNHNILNAKINDLDFLRSLKVDYIVTKRKFDLPILFQQDNITVYNLN